VNDTFRIGQAFRKLCHWIGSGIEEKEKKERMRHSQMEKGLSFIKRRRRRHLKTVDFFRTFSIYNAQSVVTGSPNFI
jgi:hypothetical protein